MTRSPVRAAFAFAVALAIAAFPLPSAADPPEPTLIAVGGQYLFPIGAFGRDRWIPVAGVEAPNEEEVRDSMRASLPVGLAVDLFDLKGRASTPWTVVRQEEGALFEGEYGVLEREPGEPGRDWIAVTAGRASIPRPVRPGSLTSAPHRAAIKELLAARGCRVRVPRLTQHLRVDLDGNGTDEVVTVAQSRSDFRASLEMRPGDYSIAAVRFLEGTTVRTEVIEYFAPGGSEGGLHLTTRILGILDLDGDGRMELVIETAYYEGACYEVFTFDGSRFRRVLMHGQGA